MDACFDVVTAHDTLEHVPEPLRASFLRDLVRVSRRYTIVNGPVFQVETSRAEDRLALFMQRALSGINASLQEHIALGLPEKSLIEGVLKATELSFISIPNGNLFRWLALMALKHYVIAFPENDWAHEVLDRTYNLLGSPRDFDGVCYREAYVAAKDQADASSLQRVMQAFPPMADR